jgi:HlyD family secretion protein
MNVGPFLRSPRVGRGVIAVAVVGAAAVAGGMWRRATVDAAYVAEVKLGTFTSQLTTSGTLRPIQSITYRSPLAGREIEIIDLAPEGTLVQAGDLLVRLDTTEIEADLERVRPEVRQIEMDLQVAEGERQDAEAFVRVVTEGEGVLTIEEAQTRMHLAQKKVDRLRHEYSQIKPLLDKGFMTREELAKTADGLEQAEEELSLARRRADVAQRITHPREKQRAILQMAQRSAQLEHLRARHRDASERLAALRLLVENSSVYARRPGMVVYEEVQNASPRRKIRIGDRVTSTQGLITIPEVDRMLLDGTVSEAEVHRVRPGQPAVVRLEAFPGVRLTGRVIRVGTLASASADRPLDEKRFDLVIEVDQTSVALRPEMTARADIETGTRENVLLLPVTAVFDQDGLFVAHVVTATGAETRSIDIGESNDLVVEIRAGLKAGERVKLTAPLTAAPATGARPAGREEGSALAPR